MLVFQYGSNISSPRLNHADRLNGDAKAVSIVSTVGNFHLEFNVWSISNNCAAADIVESEDGRPLMGVLYEIPDFLISREAAQPENRKSLDAIENQGVNYDRRSIRVIMPGGEIKSVITYVVINKRKGFKTSQQYAQHIVDGLKEHGFPQDYVEYVISTIEQNNKELAGVFKP